LINTKKFISRRRIILSSIILLYVIGNIRFLKCLSSINAYIWWFFLFLILFLFSYRFLNSNLRFEKFDLFSILSLFFAGLIALQLNQPLFSPVITEYQELSTYNETWLYWPIDFYEEAFQKEKFCVTEYQITVTPPLFPFSNKASIHQKEKYDGDDRGEIDKLWKPEELIFLKGTKGPIKCVYDKVYTTSDGFSWRKAILNIQIYKKADYSDDLDIIIKDLSDPSWGELSENELNYFSKILFSNQVNLSRYFFDQIYSEKMGRFISKVENNIINLNSEQPDFFYLSACVLEIINISDKDQIFRFNSRGFYPRLFFLRDLRDKNSKSSGFVRSEIDNLHMGTITLRPSQKNELSILCVKYRRKFEAIFPKSE